jgi:Mg-chelatase subunit ChlD
MPVSTFSRLALPLCAALVLGGCLDHPLKQVEYEKTIVDRRVVDIAINKDVDILFVIDNSGSMAEEQALLSANFKAFIDVLERDT